MKKPRISNWRPDNWVNPYGGKSSQSVDYLIFERKAFEKGADTMLEALKPLIIKIAPSSKLMDILYGEKPK